MTLQEQYIERLRVMVEVKFGRSIATIEECHDLADAVSEAVDIHLDAKDYASLFVPKSGMTVRPVTLTALTKYVGYESWSSFCTSSDITPAEDSDVIPTPRYWGVAILTTLAIIVVVVTALLLLRDDEKETSGQTTVVEVISSVEDRWHARTLEECNTIRAYFDKEDYVERVDNFIVEYCTTLYDDIFAMLMLEAQQNGLVIPVEELALHAESIAGSCYAMCEALSSEISLSIED